MKGLEGKGKTLVRLFPNLQVCLDKGQSGFRIVYAVVEAWFLVSVLQWILRLRAG
jgi:hypothetical protein